MKFILPVIAVLLLCSCAGRFYTNPTEKIYGASEVKVEYFEEWGLFRTTGYGVVSSSPESFDPSDFSFEEVCRDIHSNADFARLVLDERTETLMIECFYQPLEPVNTDRFIDDLVESMLLNSHYVWVKNDSAYRILYSGDSVHVVAGTYYNHKMVCAMKDRDRCFFDKDFEELRYRMPYRGGPFYEISLPATGAVRSLSILVNPSDLKGYEPLKLDPSILPLESPGYKKLREYEESLGKRF